MCWPEWACPFRMLFTSIAADKAFPFDINRAQPQSDVKRP